MKKAYHAPMIVVEALQMQNSNLLDVSQSHIGGPGDDFDAKGTFGYWDYSEDEE